MRWIRYALIALAPIALGLGIWWTFFRQGSPLPNSRLYVDVTTGEMISIPTDQVRSIPGMNKQGEFALFPVEKDQTGAYVIHERYREALAPLVKDPRLRVDMTTYRLKSVK